MTGQHICSLINQVLSFYKRKLSRILYNKRLLSTEESEDDEMAKEIFLNDTLIKVQSFEHRMINNLHEISVDFEVTSEEYHDIATLLYQGTFDVRVPERALAFRGTIEQYSTSFTNLYKKGQVVEYHLCLLEVNN